MLENKNVGMINFHCADNFGAVLQAYALQTTVKMLGYNAEIIDFKPKYIIDQHKSFSNIKQAIKKLKIAFVIKKILFSALNYRNEKIRSNKFYSFRTEFLNLSSDKFLNSRELFDKKPFYNYYITGSDQVWNPNFKKNIGDSYFLDFVEDTSTRIAYAASIAEEIEGKLVEDYSKLINRFNFISIREKSSLAFLNSITSKKVEVALDPTLLLEKQRWNEISKKPNILEKYILVYDLQENNELIKIANKISSKTGLKIVTYSKNKLFKNVIGNIKYVGPDEFLGYFEEADFILTNSFHGTVFSVIYNKPFYTVPHTTRGSRMLDLLKTLNLEDRVLYKLEDLKDFNKKIDFHMVTSILESQRNTSLDYLKRALKK